MPLGKISKRQILQGYQALSEIETVRGCAGMCMHTSDREHAHVISPYTGVEKIVGIVIAQCLMRSSW
jgi:hypothetical protein